MIQRATGIQGWAESFPSSDVGSLVSSTVDKASDKEMSFISLCVLPRGSFMGTFLELINKLKSSKWGVGIPREEL